MKKTILLTLFALLLTLNAEAKNVDGNLIIKKDGVSYVKAEQGPFTGNAYFFFQNGKTKK